MDISPHDRIVELSSHSWPELREIFLKNWPENQLGYYLVDDYIKWVAKDAVNYLKNVKFYTLNGQFLEHGTFVVVDRYQLFIYSLDDTNEQLLRLLRLLDWKKGFLVSSFRKKFLPAVLTVIIEKNLKIEYNSENFLHFLSKEDAKKLVLNVPCGYQLRRLSTEGHAETANEIWPYRHEGSLFYLKRLIDLNVTLGVFKKDTDELIAWCFRFQSGVLGALQVKQPYLRQGFGKLVTKGICKILGEMEMDVLALVADNNRASKKTFKACGFQIIDCCHWIKTIPQEPFEWSD